MQLRLEARKVGALMHGRAADDDGVGGVQSPHHQRPVEFEDARLPHHVAVIGQHERRPAPQRPLAHLAHRIGEVQMDDIRLLAHPLQREAGAQRRGSHGGQTTRPHHPHAALHRIGRVLAPGKRHQRRDRVAAPRLPFGQQLQVVLDAPHHRGIIFVDVQDIHAIVRYTSSVRRAACSQLKRAACARPFVRISSRNAAFANTVSIAAASAAGCRISTRRAAFPATSGRLEPSEQITGAPQAIASSTGSPNPSYNDGKTNSAAPP